MRLWAFRQLRESLGQYSASVAVVAVVAAFAVLLVEVAELANTYLPRLGFSGENFETFLFSLMIVFLGIAVLVAIIVIANTFATVYAGRVRQIALLRLVGARGRQIRRSALLDGVAVGLLGTVAGIAAGIGVSLIGLVIVNGLTGFALEFQWAPRLLIIPFVGAAAAVWASASGVRAIATVSPAEATRSVPEGGRLTERSATTRTAVGLTLFLVGLGTMVLTMMISLGPLGLLVAFAGGVLGVIGLVRGAPVVFPPVVSAVVRLLPARASTRLAGANLRLDPVRTSRTILAVTIGAMLLSMFSAAGESLRIAVRSMAPADDIPGVDATINALVGGAYGLISFSVLVSILGLGSALTMSVIQRRRELAMLRSLGFTRSQLRGTLVAESVVMTTVGVGVGLLLGTAYGFIGARAVFGTAAGLLPTHPPLFVPALIVGAVLFGVAASLAPARRAGRVPPADALRDA